jgi:phage/plasmid-associated DNA primase
MMSGDNVVENETKLSFEKSIEFINNLTENDNHDYFAKLFADNNNDYIYSEKLDLWYEYDTFNKLRGGTKKPPISLTYSITSNLQCIISNHKKILLSKDIFTIKNKDEQKKYIDSIKILVKVYNKLGDTTYTDNIIKKFKYYCKVDNLDELIDNNKYLICFNDLVYDFTINKFRKILKTDYCFFNTTYDKPKPDKLKQDKIKEIIYSCFDNDEIYKFIIDSLSLSLIGNDNNKFYIWTGKGGNGKGLLNSLLMTALGDYYYQTSNTFITSEHSDEKPNSNLYNLKGRRYSMISEPSENNGRMKFNLSFLKLITSNNDKINVRKLYNEPISYTPLFTPFLQCNLIPDLVNVGDAEIRRICIINFPFSFKKNPNKNNKFEKLVNLDYSNLVKNKDIGGQFLLMLIDNLYNKLYHPNKFEDFKYNKIVSINVPNVITKYTSNYLLDNDIILNYINENIDITNDSKDTIKKSQLYEHFRNSVNDKSISNKAFYNKLSNEGFNLKKSNGIFIYFGIKYKCNNDILSEDDNSDVINEKTKCLDV